ncbi:MAG: pyridoxine 5'-phosphate synthase [Pseudomonadota bacterium]
MATLSVNVDHVATLRQARGGVEPDPVAAAAMAELAGAEGIIVHLREDRRHIQDRDLRLLRETVKTRLNLEMAATAEMIRIAGEVKPNMCTLVPEKRLELTTEGGLEVAGALDQVQDAVARLHDAGIPVSLFIDADERQIYAARKVGADIVEIHTGHYADAREEAEAYRLKQGIIQAVKEAASLGLGVNLGHGLNYFNIRGFAGLDEVGDYSIGHALMARAILTGLDRAVRDMVRIVKSL